MRDGEIVLLAKTQKSGEATQQAARNLEIVVATIVTPLMIRKMAGLRARRVYVEAGVEDHGRAYEAFATLQHCMSKTRDADEKFIFLPEGE